MEQIFHIGGCPICKDYGRMEILFDTADKKCFAMCEECLLEFSSISDYINNKNGRRVFLSENDTITVRPAALEETENTEWYPYITDRVCD